MLNTQTMKDHVSERCHLNWKERSPQSLEGNVHQRQGKKQIHKELIVPC